LAEETDMPPQRVLGGPSRDAPFWNPCSGIFDGGQLRLAIVMRGWTVAEFAATAKISSACLYNALGGTGISDRTAIRIFQGLALRQPLPLLEVANAR
jgi:hypothetical protein